ncbi:MAG TPA: S9 family peptidase [Opitutaceae bacterium]|nr:S9 family peptidase [Opitutaceae bacterium]
MKLSQWMVAVVAIGAALRAAEIIPVEDFARVPEFSQMQLSPDGQFFAFLREHEGKPTLFFSDMQNRKTTGVDPGQVPVLGASKEVISFRWISDRRVVFTTAFWDQLISGVTAVDRDGRHWKVLSGIDASLAVNDSSGYFGAFETIHCFEDAGQNILMLDRSDYHGEDVLYPDVAKVCTLNAQYETVVNNPGNVVRWGVDHTGCVRVGVTLTDKLNYGFTYRENEGAPWHTVQSPDKSHGEIRPLGFDYSNQKLYVAALSPKRRWAIYPFDPATGGLGNAVMDDPDYDVAPKEIITPTIDGIALDQPIFSDQKKALVGVYYLTEGPRVRWFDHDFTTYQQTIDAALPNTVNLIKSRTNDEKSMLVFAFSDQDPGTYYLFDTTTQTLTRLGSRMGWIKPELMASKYPVKYKARDGQLIHGYLTLPPGRPQKNLPLVVMPHGGPAVRDVWEFDPLVQMLANRGYAVLQMNYRGSPGYGEAFYKNGRREIGRGIQDDIEDGTRWAIKKGLADPQHIAIVGASYGGYSTLFALGHNPDLYRCGISIAGVTDWLALGRGIMVGGEYKYAREYWRQQIGDLKIDEDFLKSISPVNFADKITAPVLIIQGKDDRTVPPKQAHAMINALEAAGHPPESLFIAHEGHGFSSTESRIAVFKAIDAFLAKNLGPGAPPMETKAESPAAASTGGKPAG